MAENKVNFGLKNVHYAPIIIAPNGVKTYGTITKIPGAVELSLEPRGDLAEFYADDILYYVTGANQGYDGTLTIANIPEKFAIECLGEEKGTNGLLTEKVTGKGANFALLFEFDGDLRNTKHILYNCSALRPTLGSSTKTSTTEPFTNELTFVAMPREEDYAVKTKTTETTNAGIHTTWYTRLDGIYNTINVATATFDKKATDPNNNAKAFRITSTPVSVPPMDITKVIINGIDVAKQGTGQVAQWSYTGGTFTLTKEYLTTLPIAKYKVELQTSVGNYLEIDLTVQQTV